MSTFTALSVRTFTKRINMVILQEWFYASIFTLLTLTAGLVTMVSAFRQKNNTDLISADNWDVIAIVSLAKL